jgi:DNA-binding beta-propeller fold protein YncE
MKIKNIPAIALLITCIAILSCKGQTNLNSKYLHLEKEIILNGVKGRIDHIDINIKDQIAYVAALGNNSLEVVDLKRGMVISGIKELDEPQGVAYIPAHNEIFVANGGTGECGFYNAVTFKKTASVKFEDDADDARYDAASDKIFVGYGSGGIGIIDAATHKLIGDITLPAHPESFQLDTKEGRMWINIPGSGIVGVADIKEAKLTDKWKRLLPRSNFPMAYDAAGHRIIVGYRFPATLKVIDSRTGKEIFSSSMVSDADDLYWDEKSKQIFVSGGGGAINIFKQTGSNAYKLVADIKTPAGARTSLLVPELQLFLLATRANGSNPAKLQLYKLTP